MQFEVRNLMVHFILLCDYATSEACSNMQLNYKHYTEERNVRIQKNKILYKSVSFSYIRLKFSKAFYLDAFYIIYSVFFNQKCFGKK